MAKIIIAEHFQKELSKIKSIGLKEIINEIKKHHKGLNNLIDSYSPAQNIKILKGYLDDKKSRFATLLVIDDKIYIPCLIEKKESKIGNNLSKENSINVLERKTKIIFKDIENNNIKEEITI